MKNLDKMLIVVVLQMCLFSWIGLPCKKYENNDMVIWAAHQLQELYHECFKSLLV